MFCDHRDIHFIGVGGVSMKSLALLCRERGMDVSGSDREDSAVLAMLAAHGINAYCGHDPGYAATRSLVVYTAAVPRDDPELAAAREAGALCMERKAFLALVASEFEKTVAIAGSHGKTTTTAMLCAILRAEGRKFVGHIGGDCVGGECASTGGDELFVTEACEYNRTFLALKPDVAAVLGIAFDHPDCYRDLAELKAAFRDFASNIERGGALVVRTSEKGLCPKGVRCVTFGYSECDYRAEDVCYSDGRYSFVVAERGVRKAVCRLKVRGKFNVVNALAAIALAAQLGIPAERSAAALEGFNGVKRRFERLGTLATGAEVFTDYAHHPDEIAAAIDTARVMTKGAIVAVFEPHTFSRTKAMAKEFVECFYWADEVLILPTYAARERPSDGESAYDLYMRLKARREESLYMPDYAALRSYLSAHTRDGDAVLLLGAGTVNGAAAGMVRGG